MNSNNKHKKRTNICSSLKGHTNENQNEKLEQAEMKFDFKKYMHHIN
jgi:hypothetical protein